MKKFQLLIAILALAALITGCGASQTSAVDSASSSSQVVGAASASNTDTTSVVSSTPAVEYDNEDLTVDISYSDLSDILLNGDSISAESAAVSVNGSVATITAAGEYRISGTLNDGQIVVDTTDPETVTLVLDNASLNASNTAPLYIANAEKVIITLAEGSSNSITDGANYVFATAEEEPNAALFSNDDLTINGSGALTVTGNYNHGIASDDDLKITGGTITVTSVNDGLKGKDSVAIKDGTITINAGGDGIQSSNAEDSEKGYVAIEGGTINIVSGLDGIQAETSLLITGGQIAITAGGGSTELAVSDMGGSGRGQGWDMQNTTTDSASTKGLKGLTNVTIEGGTIVIDSLDDTIHSNNTVVISGGNLQLATSDDGIHADSSITINGGTINLTRSYEGIEAMTITINDGEIHLTSSDDGINGSDGSGGGGMGGGMTASSGVWVSINGGYLYINAGGDGLDSNGTVAMTGGVVLDNGPTNNGNGALDYMGSFNISGGILVAVGSTGMAQAPSSDSSQYSVIYSLDSYAAAGTLLHIETADGQEIITFAPAKEYQSVVVSTPEMANGESYVVYSGGSDSGTETDGLYTGGSYTPGTQVTTFSISSIVTSVNGAGFGGGMPGGGGAPGGGGGRHP